MNPAAPVHPAAPPLNAGLAQHPDVRVRLTHGWNPGTATSRTGNVLSDLLLNIGAQYMPTLTQRKLDTTPIAPLSLKRQGNEFYANVAGRTSIAEQLAAQRAHMSGLLGALQQVSPQSQPYVEGLRTSLMDPQFRTSIGGLAPLL